MSSPRKRTRVARLFAVLLSIAPKMKILKCYVGEDETEPFDAIKADAGL